MLKMLHSIIVALAVSAALSMPQAALAQQQVESYKFDVGAGVGFSGYLGDANESNLFKHIGAAFNIEGRYLINERWNLRAQFTYAGISGNSAEFENKFPNDMQYKFKANLYDLGFRGEVNFFSFGIGETYRRLRRWSPFLSLGLGMTLSSCDAKVNAGFNIPMGVGIRYKLRQRINLSAEFTMTKVFSDKMDGDFKDPYQIKSQFLKNTDWYSTFLIGISYEFGPRCVVCHRID